MNRFPTPRVPKTTSVDTDIDIRYLSPVVGRASTPVGAPKAGERRDPRRAAILEAGEQLFAREGYDAVNSNQIARAAGVGVGTFYRHFQDKAALAEAIMLQAWEELGRALPGPEVSAPREAAARATTAVVEYAVQQPERFRVAFGGAQRGRLALSLRPLERRLREFAARGQLNPALDAAVAARAWWSLVCATTLWWLNERDPVPRTELVRSLVLLHPLIAAPPPQPAPRPPQA